MKFNELILLAAALATAILVLKIAFVVRGRSMRALAQRSGLQFVGPPGPRFVFGYLPKIKPALPFSRHGYPLAEIRQTWNVIEGERGGVRIVIFDSLLYRFPAVNKFCTFVACHADGDPFGIRGPKNDVLQIDQVVRQPGGWILLYRMARVHTLVPWSISIKRLERALDMLDTRGEESWSLDRS